MPLRVSLGIVNYSYVNGSTIYNNLQDQGKPWILGGNSISFKTLNHTLNFAINPCCHGTRQEVFGGH